MIERIVPHTIPDEYMTDEQKAELLLAEWAFDSHYWIEHPKKYYRCRWCERTHAKGQLVDKNFPLCPENPKIKNLIIETKRGG